MLNLKPLLTLLSRELRFPQAFARQGGARATSSFIRCCDSPNDRPKKEASIPASQIVNVEHIHVTGGEVHFHIGEGRGQTAAWAAVAMSPEAKALLQKHAVKASTALKMHNVLGFEDVGDLQHLSPDLVARLELKPLQLAPLLHMLRDQQQQQDTPLIVGMQQEQQQQQQDGSEQQQDSAQALQGAGRTGATPSLQTAHASPPPAVSQAAHGSSASAKDTEAAVPASAGVAAEGGMPPAAPAARAGAHAERGTDGHTQAGGGLTRHACVAVMKAKGKAGTVSCVAITPDGRRAVTAGPGSEVHVWDLEARRYLAALKGHTADVAAVAITPDGRHAVSSSRDDTLRVWDLDTYACVDSRAMDSEDSCIDALAMTPDGRHVLYGDGHQLCKWALDDTAAWMLDGCSELMSCVAVSPDGRLAVTGSRDNNLCVWDLEANKVVGVLRGHTDTVCSVAITPDGRHAVSASYGRRDVMRVWDLASRTCIGTLKGQESWFTCVAISPDGRRAVSGGADCALRVWDLATRTCTGIMEKRPSWVGCVAFTPDGRYVVTGGEGLEVWDLAPSSAGSKAPWWPAAAGSPR